jgi:hypothetical protein
MKPDNFEFPATGHFEQSEKPRCGADALVRHASRGSAVAKAMADRDGTPPTQNASFSRDPALRMTGIVFPSVSSVKSVVTYSHD